MVMVLWETVNDGNKPIQSFWFFKRSFRFPIGFSVFPIGNFNFFRRTHDSEFGIIISSEECTIPSSELWFTPKSTRFRIRNFDFLRRTFSFQLEVHDSESGTPANHIISDFIQLQFNKPAYRTQQKQGVSQHFFAQKIHSNISLHPLRLSTYSIILKN